MKWPLIAAFVVALRTPALATPTAADRDLAREVMKQGKGHEAAGSLDDALAAYRIADDLLGDPVTKTSLCRVLARVGKLVEARDTCLSAIQLPKQSREPTEFGKARAEATDLAVDLEERVPSLELVIKGLDKAKATVSIDGTDIDDYAGALSTDPGQHRVVVKASGYENGVAEITLVEGQAAKLNIAMKRTGQTAAEGNGAASFHPIFWVGIAATAVGLGAGIGTGIFVINEKKRLDEACPQAPLCPPEFKSDHDTAVALAHVSTVSFVLAGAGVAMIVGGIFLPTGNDEVGVLLQPGGITLRGRF